MKRRERARACVHVFRCEAVHLLFRVFSASPGRLCVLPSLSQPGRLGFCSLFQVDVSEPGRRSESLLSGAPGNSGGGSTSVFEVNSEGSQVVPESLKAKRRVERLDRGQASV